MPKPCPVCSHSKVDEIDAALRSGRQDLRGKVRSLALAYAIPAHLLSYHAAVCLHMVEPQSPTASANQTYFKGLGE
jgi:hypothetical protein